MTMSDQFTIVLLETLSLSNRLSNTNPPYIQSKIRGRLAYIGILSSFNGSRTNLYRPIIHREALAAGRRKSAVPLRPVMDRPETSSSSTASGGRRESGAQTDISALPAQWRSESYLAHKVAHTFTTLPSKFALPTGVMSSGRLRLSDKTREARRVMLSDISFTSMVPELSRSADHLCQEPNNQVNTMIYMLYCVLEGGRL